MLECFTGMSFSSLKLNPSPSTLNVLLLYFIHSIHFLLETHSEPGNLLVTRDKMMCETIHSPCSAVVEKKIPRLDGDHRLLFCYQSLDLKFIDDQTFFTLPVANELSSLVVFTC